ncbi:HNH endonuclease [Pseudomonas aeruginosa]|uniref:HNH endonuclease n=1 Tax=Pseudomonas aeruginosa TaxID=287 RepID=UPI0015E713F0|nr:HNH endonuclease [Pseudomonas aeruginosa]
MPSADTEIEKWGKVSVNEMYLVSSLGRIKSLRKGRILNNSPRVNGYISVSLTFDDGSKKRFYVHRLVAEAFCGGVPKGMVVNHLNFIRNDNRAANLEVVAPYQNILYSKAAGRYADAGRNTPVGEKSPCSKLNEADVREIRERFSAGASKASLAIEYGVVQQQICNIVQRISWRHVA